MENIVPYLFCLAPGGAYQNFEVSRGANLREVAWQNFLKSTRKDSKLFLATHENQNKRPAHCMDT